MPPRVAVSLASAVVRQSKKEDYAMVYGEAVQVAKAKYPKSVTKTIKYGTAGFRTK